MDIPRPLHGNAVNMVQVWKLREGSVHTATSSTRSTHTEVLHLDDGGYDLDLPPNPLGFPRLPRFPPRRGDMVLNVSNDEPPIEGETDDQCAMRELHNTGRAERHALEAVGEEAGHRGP
jgi:hypothetical protein